MHEHDAHQFRLQHLDNEPGITIRSLDGTQSKRLCLSTKRAVRIDCVQDIDLLEEGDYGVPSIHNFPFLDAVMKPNFIFLDTTARKHSLTSKLSDIVKA